MNIYLIRHSKAEPASPGKKDKDRELTSAGFDIITSAAKSWRPWIDNFDYLFTSPFIRAVQTSNTIKDIISIANDIKIENLLEPGCKVGTIIRLATEIDADNIAFVGHQPDLSFILSMLISNYDINLKFSPGSIAKISFKEKPIIEKGVLELLLPPS